MLGRDIMPIQQMQTLPVGAMVWHETQYAVCCERSS